MAEPVDWSGEAIEDYRKMIIIDANNPILAFKASRGRYVNLRNRAKYAGLPHLGSWQLEDALTWNVFRSLQKARSLGVITNKLKIASREDYYFGHLRLKQVLLMLNFNIRLINS